MRLWSLNPKLLDSKGLVACWREGLLALNVLQGKTRGYKNHPQLNRFKMQKDPIQSLCSYLHSIASEAKERSYNFNIDKIPLEYAQESIPVTRGQILYEHDLLSKKVEKRGGLRFEKLGNNYAIAIATNLYIFYNIDGEIESWEKVKEF